MAFEEPQTINVGAALRDIEAVGDDRTSQADWLKERKIDPDARIRLTKVSHMRYQHPDLDELNRFMLGKRVETKSQSNVLMSYYLKLT